MSSRSPWAGQFVCASSPSMIFLDPRQMAGQRFVPLLLGDGARHRVGLHDRLGLGLRLGPSRLEFLAAFKRQQRLVLSRKDPFLAPMAVDEMAQQLPQLLHFDREFLDLLRLRCDGRRLLRKARGLNSQQRLAGIEIIGNFVRLDHGTDDNRIVRKRKSSYARIGRIPKIFSRKRESPAVMRRFAPRPWASAHRTNTADDVSRSPVQSPRATVPSRWRPSQPALRSARLRPLEGAAFQTLHPNR